MNCFGSRKKNSYTVSGDASNTEESNQKNGKSKEKKNADDDKDHKVEQVTDEATDGAETIKENSGTEGSRDQNVDDDKAKINTAPDADKDKKNKKHKKKEELDNKKEKKEKEKKEKKEKEKKKGSTENLDNKKKDKKDKKSKKDQKSEKDEKGEVNGAGPDAGLTAEDDSRSFPEVGLVPEDATEVVLVPGDVETDDKFDASDPDCCHQIGDRSNATTEHTEFETDANEITVSHQHTSSHAETCQPEDDYDARDDAKDDVIRDDDAVNEQPEEEAEVGSMEGNGDVSGRHSLNEGCSDRDQETEGQGLEGQGHDGQQRLTEMAQ